MTFTAERIIHNTQFNPSFEVNSLRRGVRPEAVLTQIVHTFAEFACNVRLTSYHYIQTPDNQLLSPGREAEGDVLNSFQRGVNSRRTFLEYQSFADLREKILETKKPSVAISFSPPGPKEEGYSNYGFFYLALIPRYTIGENGEKLRRRIAMLALRVNDFDEQTSRRTLDLIHLLSGKQAPQGASLEERLLKSCVVLPLGKKEKIKSVKEPLALIGLTLNQGFDETEIKAGLSRKALKGVYEKFKREIHRVYTNIWLASKGLPAEINGERLFQGMPISLISGSCPAAMAAQEATATSSTEGAHWCPVCGIWFSGKQCPCGYRLS